MIFSSFFSFCLALRITVYLFTAARHVSYYLIKFYTVGLQIHKM
jgi:hypothetical protein